jgi:hypothetical protein
MFSERGCFLSQRERVRKKKKKKKEQTPSVRE